MRFTTTALILFGALTVLFGCSNSTTPPPDGGTDVGTDSGDDGGMSCPPGESYYEPGCGTEGEIVITAGCYSPCGGDPTRCVGGGMACQTTTINPCICTEGEVCCGACGAEEQLCLPWDPGDTDPYELADLDEECDGLTGQQILDVAGGSHTAPFTYAGTDPDTELTLTFTYTDGTITCQPAITQPPGVGAPDLPARVDLEVDATVATADGAFDEAASATLQHMGGFGGPTSVLHNFEFDAAALGGSYTPADPDLVDAVRFGGTITESGLQGNAFEDGRSPGGAMTVAPIGSWDTLP